MKTETEKGVGKGLGEKTRLITSGPIQTLRWLGGKMEIKGGGKG